MRSPCLLFRQDKSPLRSASILFRVGVQKIGKKLMCVDKETEGVNNDTVVTVNVNPV